MDGSAVRDRAMRIESGELASNAEGTGEEEMNYIIRNCRVIDSLPHDSVIMTSNMYDIIKDCTVNEVQGKGIRLKGEEE